MRCALLLLVSRSSLAAHGQVAWNLTAVAEAVAHGRPPAPPVQVGVLAAPQVRDGFGDGHGQQDTKSGDRVKQEVMVFDLHGRRGCEMGVQDGREQRGLTVRGYSVRASQRAGASRGGLGIGAEPTVAVEGVRAC